MITSGHRKIICIATALSALVVVMCVRQPDHTLHEVKFSFPTTPVFKGKLRIFVASWEKTMTVTMDPAAGRGSSGPYSEWLDPKSPRCGESGNYRPQLRTLVSPDGALSIPCEWTDTLVIHGSQDELVVSHTFVPRARIRDVVWSPDSTSIAVLVEETRDEYFSRQGLLSLLTVLQPVHLTHYRLFLYSPKFNASEELPFPYDNIQGAWAAMEWLPS